MKRPMVDGDHWRLDVILERKAVSVQDSTISHFHNLLSVCRLVYQDLKIYNK